MDGVPIEEDDESTNSNITTAQFIRNIVSEFSNAANVALRNTIAPNPFNPETETPAISSGSARTTVIPPIMTGANTGSAMRDSSTDPEAEQEVESPFGQIDSSIRQMYFETSPPQEQPPPSTREIVATLMMNPTQATQTSDHSTPAETPRETSSTPVMSEAGPSSMNTDEVPEG